MLLPTNSPAPVASYQQEIYHSVREKTKLFASKCRTLSPEGKNDTFRGRFRFCVCTGPRKSVKKTTKWYVKVRKCCFSVNDQNFN